MASLSRYRHLNTLQDTNNGKQYVESSNFPTQQQLDAIPTIQIVSSEFDRIDNLSFKYLGSGEYYWVIMIFNPSLDWPLIIPEGTILQIPTDINAVLNLF